MVNYECQRCGYSTTHKCVFKKHLLRKNLCNSKIKEITKYELLVLNGFKEESNMYKKPTNNPPIIHQNPPLKKEYICKYCDKQFTRSDALKRHMDSRCKNKQQISVKIEDLMDKMIILNKKIEEMDKENKELRNQLNQKKNLNIKKINNSTINNHIQNQHNNNIQINNYGSENIDYITDKVFKKLLTKPISAITRLIELKHFHPNHPENHNVKITNIHDKFAKIYQDKKWIIKHKKDIVEELVENGYADFEEFKDLNEDELAEKIKEKYKLMKDNYENNFDKICQKSELSIINETKNSIEV